MIQSGFTIENPYAQSHITLLPSAAADNGTGWLLEVRRPAGSGPDNTEHLHTTWTETFEILAGEAAYKLGGATGRLRAGDSLAMPPNQFHIHPWNAGESELVYRQTAAFAPPDRQALQEVIGGIATIAAFAREGGLSDHGQPKHPLQLAATLRLAIRYGRYDASLPFWVQKGVAATLGRLAEALGYHAVHQRYRSGSLPAAG